jgi:hypothetical protein
MVGELQADLKGGRRLAVTTLLKCIHDAVRSVRSEVDLAADSPWGRQLAAVRSEVSSALRTEIESTPGRVRRLLRSRPADKVAPAACLDPGEVADTEASIALLGACRYASELAVSEATLRAYTELQQYLDTGTHSLVERRDAGPTVSAVSGRGGGAVLRQALRPAIRRAARQSSRSCNQQ